MAEEFAVAHMNEQKHDVLVKGWLQALVMMDAGVA
jgi:hypothetical protein